MNVGQQRLIPQFMLISVEQICSKCAKKKQQKTISFVQHRDMLHFPNYSLSFSIPTFIDLFTCVFDRLSNHEHHQTQPAQTLQPWERTRQSKKRTNIRDYVPSITSTTPVARAAGPFRDRRPRSERLCVCVCVCARAHVCVVVLPICPYSR